MPATVHCNMRTVVHQSSGDMSIAFPDVCLTPAGPAPVPIPYPNIAQASDAANGAATVLADGNPIMVKDSYFATSSGDEGGTAGGNVVTGTIKGKAYFALYSFDVKAEGKNVCRFLDPMTHNHSSSPPPGTPPAPDIGGAMNVPAPKEIKPKTLTARMQKVTLKSDLPLESKGITSKRFKNPFPAGPLPPSGQPNWQRNGDGSPPPANKRFPAVYTIEGGGSKKALTATVVITELENLSGQADLIGRCLESEINGKAKVKLEKNSPQTIDCEFDELPEKTRYERAGGIQWFLVVDGDEFAIGETKIEIFFIYKKPAPPWEGNPLWYEALHFAFVQLKVGYLNAPGDLLKNITRNLHRCGLHYDTKGGAPGCHWAPGETDFQLSELLKIVVKPAPANRVNCYDMAAAVMAFGALIGIPRLEALFLGNGTGPYSYGYISATHLVGMAELCNDPFYEGRDTLARAEQAVAPKDERKQFEFGPMKSQYYRRRTSFGNHAVAIRGSRIFDACAGPYVTKGNVKDYTKHSIDRQRCEYQGRIDPRGGYGGWSLEYLWNQNIRYTLASVS